MMQFGKIYVIGNGILQIGISDMEKDGRRI